MKRVIVVVLLAACSRDPEGGARKTLSAMGLAKPDAILCEERGCEADTCLLRWGDRRETWVCDSNICRPRTAGDDVKVHTEVVPQTIIIPSGR